MLRTRIVPYLLVAAVALLLYPSLGEAACAVALHPDSGRCHTGADQDAGTAGAAESTAPATADCCTTGCQDCGLPCCTGLTVVVSDAPAVAAAVCAFGPPERPRAKFASIDPDPLDHPPRS